MRNKTDKENKSIPFPKEELIFLLLKIAILAGMVAAVFTFVFGILHCSGNAMNPAVRDGDLVFYYRLEQEYRASDVVVVEKDGEFQILRIIATAGDEVDLTEEGLNINGYLQQEPEIYKETLPYVEGISFPVNVGENEYFVLGDNRTSAKDSRMFGCIRKDEIKGSVMTILRRRNF